MFSFVSGHQTFSEWSEACQVALVYYRETTGQVSFHLEVVWYSTGRPTAQPLFSTASLRPHLLPPDSFIRPPPPRGNPGAPPPLPLPLYIVEGWEGSRTSSLAQPSLLIHLLLYNTPDVTFHICNSNSYHFRLCVMIFSPWSGFVFRFVFCSCHAFHIMSSCALHLHTCSSHASEHFPRCPFCNPALLSPPVHPSCFLS